MEALAASGAIQAPPRPPALLLSPRPQPPAVACVAVRGRRLAALTDPQQGASAPLRWCGVSD